MTVSNNSKDNSTRVKRKYVPMKDRVPSGNIPFCERTDLTEKGKSFLFGVEDLQEIASKSNRTLADSRWALPEDRIKAGLKSTPDKMETMPPPIKTEGPKPHAFHQKTSLGTGLNSSRWATSSSFSKPNISPGTATTTPTRQPSSHSSNNFMPEQPYVPPHLRIAELAIKSETTSGADVESPSRLPATETTHQQLIPPHLRGARQVSGGETNNPQSVLAQLGDFSPIKDEKVDVDRSTRALYNVSEITGSPMKVEQSGGFRCRDNNSEAHDRQFSKLESITPTHSSQSVLPASRFDAMSQVTSSNEEAFLKFMEKQPLERLQAAKLDRSTPLALSKNSSSNLATKPRPSFNTEVEPKFNIEINESSDQSFQGFLEKKKTSPVANGKKYIKVETSSQLNGQDASPSVSNGFPSRTDQQKENMKPFGKFDPHAVFSPRDLKTPERGEVIDQSNHTSRVAATSSTGWGPNPLTDKKLLNSSILADLNAQRMLPPSPVRLTEDILVEKFGFSPQHSVDTFRISDTGMSEHPREIVRATQGKDATQQLLDWDGSMLPAPCDWETDRGIFDISFMPKYIMEWQGSGVPCGPSVTVDTILEGFRSGKQPIDNDELKEPIIQPDSIPDIENSINEKARIHQTSDYEAVNFMQKVERRQQNLQRQIVDSDARLREIMSRPPEVNPFSAKIPMYLRPATKQDASDIALIYNHYVAHSAVTEDQQPISEKRVEELLDYFHAEKLPLIVAVKGHLPASAGSMKPKLPQYEAIIGFAYADIFNFGLNFERTGRSRATATLQFYVHHEYTRRGIGRNLFDRLMHSMSFGYAFKNASSWVNPDNDQVYEAGGGGHWHQLLVQLSIERENDQMYPWFKEFMLNKFFFKEEARLPALGRTSGHQGKAAVWLDLVFFQNEASHGDEFQYEG